MTFEIVLRKAVLTVFIELENHRTERTRKLLLEWKLEVVEMAGRQPRWYEHRDSKEKGKDEVHLKRTGKEPNIPNKNQKL